MERICQPTFQNGQFTDFKTIKLYHLLLQAKCQRDGLWIVTCLVLSAFQRKGTRVRPLESIQKAGLGISLI